MADDRNFISSGDPKISCAERPSISRSALKHFNKTAEIVFFPRENHNLTRTGEPKHLVESLNWQLYWFDRYLEGKKEILAPDWR